MSKNSSSTKAPVGQSSGVSPWLAGLSALCVVGLAGLIILLSTLGQSQLPPNLNGDAVGPESGEDIAAYAARADNTLAETAASSNDRKQTLPDSAAPRYWALVTFDHPLNDADTAAAFAELPNLRVASVLIGAVVTRDLPEPSEAATRQQLIAHAIEHVTISSGLEPGDSRLMVSNAVVFGDIKQLQALRQAPHVAAVEPLPLGAQRGRFGVRPYYGPELELNMQPPAESGDQPGFAGEPSNGTVGEGS